MRGKSRFGGLHKIGLNPSPGVLPPETQLHQCLKCGAVVVPPLTAEEGATGPTPFATLVIDPEKSFCGDIHEWAPLLPTPAHAPTYPGDVPVPYAQKVLSRLHADREFLLEAIRTGDPDEAAGATCEEHGHDVRGGVCERCGLRVGAERR